MIIIIIISHPNCILSKSHSDHGPLSNFRQHAGILADGNIERDSQQIGNFRRGF